ncbi:YceI family protein [Roseivirga sp. BDSF3-8]|uniref:YceI family protein n=1 Tax=Roseivirga sp. BDSF3-8 TaxID=3241598 RepID=UPI00353186F1
MKKNILFLVLLAFSVTAIFLNFNTPENSRSSDFRHMSFTGLFQEDSYQVDAEASEVKWTGRKLTGNHTGTVKIKSGNLNVDGDKLEGGMFIIDMTSMENEDIEDPDSRAKLMGHLRSEDFFGTATHPEAKLVITNVTYEEETEQYRVTGDLTIKGKTNSITFPAGLSNNGNTVTASADITFDRTKWDVRYGSGSIFKSLGDKAIYDDVDISVRLVARQ